MEHTEIFEDSCIDVYAGHVADECCPTRRPGFVLWCCCRCCFSSLWGRGETSRRVRRFKRREIALAHNRGKTRAQILIVDEGASLPLPWIFNRGGTTRCSYWFGGENKDSPVTGAGGPVKCSRWCPTVVMRSNIHGCLCARCGCDCCLSSNRVGINAKLRK